MTETTPNLLFLLSLPGIGSVKARRLFDHVGAAAFASITRDQLLQELWVIGVKAADIPDDKICDAARKSEEIVSRSESMGVRILNMESDEFPSQVNDVKNPPVIIYAKGEGISHLKVPSVAVVGTREPTSFGTRSARRIAASFAEAGLCVVSGLALGCDTEAHLGCLEGGGRTIAVMAHGLDTVYPAKNRDLADTISQNGCLISEYPVGMKANRVSFVERDRLQSGLARALVVIETDVKGGTMHTVGFAKAQSRRISALVHTDNYREAEKARGNQHLIANGTAVPLRDKRDVEDIISFVKGERPKASEASPERSTPVQGDLGF